LGIRPAYYYYNDEIVVAASERPAIMTAFNIPIEEIKEIKPGHALIVKKNGKITEDMFSEPLGKESHAHLSGSIFHAVAMHLSTASVNN
jgi:amidophosphoribosyltransferase